ncbi:hypothetical protein GDO78_001857 [Eleutherodactylus coqui]|uniref:Peptidase S54 rhomboid domain-containing protein n=1 Tax=Eleutherodactylus coqui TaxID=57060 RepID=A0A8J6KP46_ELECQ|nr:hypothetical protein GDO78_001857 [Eleutherodactylus coqui]
MQRRRRGLDLGLGFLFFNIYQFGLDNIPPVTLTVLGLNVYLFLKPLKPLEYCCISVNEVYYERDWERFLLAPFHHVDDWHLYFNMLSLIWKGSTLERRLGSALFAKIIVVFSLLTDVVYVLLEFLLSEITHDEYYMIQCAVGFSGVLFALKVLINHYYPGWSIIIFDIQVPNKYACWAELVLIYLLIPK